MVTPVLEHQFEAAITCRLKHLDSIVPLNGQLAIQFGRHGRQQPLAQRMWSGIFCRHVFRRHIDLLPQRIVRSRNIQPKRSDHLRLMSQQRPHGHMNHRRTIHGQTKLAATQQCAVGQDSIACGSFLQTAIFQFHQTSIAQSTMATACVEWNASPSQHVGQQPWLLLVRHFDLSFFVWQLNRQEEHRSQFSGSRGCGIVPQQDSTHRYGAWHSGSGKPCMVSDRPFRAGETPAVQSRRQVAGGGVGATTSMTRSSPVRPIVCPGGTITKCSRSQGPSTNCLSRPGSPFC